MSKISINPEELYDCAPFGMSQATVDTEAGLVYVSGQVAWNLQMETTDDTVGGQLREALGNLETALTAAGSSIRQLLQVRVYVRGELGEHMEAIVPVLTECFGDARPSLTGLGVASLASPSTLVEVEAVASVR